MSEVKKKLLRMGIRTDNDGYIYFNELLYKLMREIYCTFKLNNTMAKYELVTQYRLFLLRKKAQGQLDKPDPSGEDFVSLFTNYARVNPFQRELFFRISWNAWYNLAMKEMRKELAQDTEDTGAQSGSLFEPVEMEVPVEVEYTSEEEEEGEDVFDDRQADQPSVAELSRSDRAFLSPALSPTNHRIRVKQRKRSAAKRLTSTIFAAVPEDGSPPGAKPMASRTRGRSIIEKASALRQRRSMQQIEDLIGSKLQSATLPKVGGLSK